MFHSQELDEKDFHFSKKHELTELPFRNGPQQGVFVTARVRALPVTEFPLRYGPQEGVLVLRLISYP